MNSELTKTVENILLRGTISVVDLKNATARGKIGAIETDFLPFGCSRAGKNIIWSPCEVGETVLVGCPQGELDLGLTSTPS